MTIQDQIEQYSDHLMDLGFIDAVLNSIEPIALFNTLAEMLQSGNIERIGNTNLFIRDVINLGLREKTQFFHENFYTSVVVDSLHKNVFAPLYVVRASSVYTIGKVDLVNSIDLLSDAFTYFLERDPFLLSDLLFELRWLGDPYTWDRIDRMAHSKSPLTRWAIFSTSYFEHFNIAQNEEEAKRVQLQVHYLDLLKTDNNVLLRQEAEYKGREFQFAQNSTSFSKPQLREARKALELEKPLITFFTVNQRFFHYLRESDKADYTLADLEDFVFNI